MAFGQGRYLLIARRTGITGPGCCLDIRDHASENSRVVTDLVSIPDLSPEPVPRSHTAQGPFSPPYLRPLL